MGNPLSPLSAEIFMNDLENKIEQLPFFKYFKFWYRYVDDILACFIGTKRQLDSLVSSINKLHKNIAFTLEVEQNNSINFLDLTISKVNSRLSFSIFRKPTYTDMVIHNTSMHPYTHKLAAFRSYIHRLLNTPLSTIDYNSELNIIKQIAVNDGYNPDLIDKMIYDFSLKQALKLVYPNNTNKNKKFYSLTYFGKPSEKIKEYLKNDNINISFKTKNTLGKYIKNNKSVTAKLQKSGEHFRSYRLDDEKSNYAVHLLDSNHIFNDDFKLLHVSNKGAQLNALEAFETNKKKSMEN